MSAILAPVRRREQAYPWAVVTGTLALSMAGNAVHAIAAHGPDVSDRTAAVAALVPPALAAVALHGLLRVLRRTPPGWPRTTVMALVVLVFAMAFVLSFAGLHALAIAVGINPVLAPLGPLIVDVTTVYAVADAMLLHHQPAAQETPASAPDVATEEPAHEQAPAAQPAHVDARTPEPAAVACDEPAEQVADDPHTAPIPRVEPTARRAAQVRTLDDAATQRAKACAHIAQLLATPDAHISSRALGREFGIGESTLRPWISKLASGEWAVTPEGALITGIPRERTGTGG
ncbi:DUF2637 domain-containing protein [Parafrankia sp. EUN1f]|uniref:DUF2637 domain-containing protein n=1 Tax=Parafrankia sp. EUN1f TaxID=102897 RepID=UPI0001C452FB|nr:DUF2637 domain-containing protein [Parafrankia sp. EUN1f]EFC79002.1 hypothetical protein FrEUN1fDRAFT_7884 [Parafrankia sp. EUN1f]